jgi:hypothetical protein
VLAPFLLNISKQISFNTLAVKKLLKLNMKIESSQKKVEIVVLHSFQPHRDAMLQALRVVLDLPRKPIVLDKNEK